jgi:hypothetical protein
MTTLSQRYNCFIRNAGNSIPNPPVQRLKVAILTLDLPCSGPVTHSGEILTTGKSHRKKPDKFSLNDNTDVKKVLRFKYATWNIRGLGEKEEELDKIFNENNIQISVITESKKKLQGRKDTEHYTVVVIRRDGPTHGQFPRAQKTKNGVQKLSANFGPTWGQLPIFLFSSILILVDGVGDGGFSYLCRRDSPGSTLSLTSFKLSPLVLP